MRFIRHFLIWWASAPCLIGVLLVVLTWDESPSPASVTLLDFHRPMVAANDNGYFLLMGWSAAKGEDPRLIGRRRVQAYEVQGTMRPSPVENGAARDLAQLCAVEERLCLSRFVEQSDTITALAQRYAYLLARYRSLYAYQRFATSATPGTAEPVIAFEQVESTQRLLHATIAVEFLKGSRLKAVEALGADMRFLRALLAQADQLPLKMSALRMLARDLHLLSELLDSPAFVHLHLPRFASELSDLDADERSLRAPIQRAFQRFAAELLTLRRADSLEAVLGMPGWMARLFYKPNATVNRAYPYFRRALTLGATAEPSLAADWADGVLAAGRRTDSRLNPVGWPMVEVLRPDLIRPIAAIRDCAGLLSLVRLKKMLRAAGIPAADIPVFVHQALAQRDTSSASGGIEWDARRKALRFAGLSGISYLSEVSVPDLAY